MKAELNLLLKLEMTTNDEITSMKRICSYYISENEHRVDYYDEVKMAQDILDLINE